MKGPEGPAGPRGASASFAAGLGKPRRPPAHTRGGGAISGRLRPGRAPGTVDIPTPQDPSPVSRRFWDQGASPCVNAAPQAAGRGPTFVPVQRLCWGSPSQVTGGDNRHAERGKDLPVWGRGCSVPSVPSPVTHRRAAAGPVAEAPARRAEAGPLERPVPRSDLGRPSGQVPRGVRGVRAPPRLLPPLEAAVLLLRLRSLLPALPPSSPARPSPRGARAGAATRARAARSGRRESHPR